MELRYHVKKEADFGVRESPGVTPLVVHELPPDFLDGLRDCLKVFPDAAGCCAYVPARQKAAYVLRGAPEPQVFAAPGGLPAVTAHFLEALAGGDLAIASAPLGDTGEQGCLQMALRRGIRLRSVERALLVARAHLLGIRLDVARLGAEVGKLRQSLAAAVHIHRLLAQGMEMEELLGAVLEPVTQLVDASGAGILLYQPASQELVLQKPAFNIGDQALIDRYRVRVEPQGEPYTVAVSVFLTGTPYVNNDPHKNPHINQQYLRLFGVRNSVTLPLTVDNRTIGVMHVINKRYGVFTEDDTRLLQLVASQLAVLIENARLVMQVRRQEKEAKLLYKIGIEISNSLDLEQVLSSVAEQSCFLVDADMATISLLDPDTRHGSVKVAAGDYNGTLRQVRFSPAVGTSAQLLTHKRPVFRRIPHAEGDVDNLDIVARSLGLRTVLAVPLIADGHVFGLLHAWRRSLEPFTEGEAELLGRLSVQAAIAVDKAHQYEYQRQSLAELRRLNNLIESQHALLQQAQAVQREMTALVLQGKGLREITETLSALVGRPAVLLDRFHRVLALAQPRDGASDPAWEALVGGGEARGSLVEVTRQLANEPNPTVLPPDPHRGQMLPWLLAPVVVEHEVLGYVALLQSHRDFRELDFVAAGQAATVCALVMLKDKTAAEVEYRLKGDLLFTLCRGRFGSEEEFLHRAAVLGYDLRQPRTVMILELASTDSESEDATHALRRVRRLQDVVRQVLPEYAPDAWMAAQGESVLILIPADGPEPRVLGGRLQAQISSMLQQTVAIGIGSACYKLPDYARSYQEACQTLLVLRRMAVRKPVASFQDLGIYQVLLQLPDLSGLRDFVQRTLGPLFDYDREHGTQLIGTLDQFLKHHGNRQSTCKALYVHINTLNYRLRRIAEILGVSLSSHRERLNLDLALRILEILDADRVMQASR